MRAGESRGGRGHVGDALKLHEQRATHLNTVTGYGPGYIEINGARHTGNLILEAGTVQAWNVAGFESLQPEDFDPVLSLGVEVVLLGTGLRHRFPPPRLTARFVRAAVALEAMDTRAACRTYNILVSDGRRVAGALLQEDAGA
jgi:uncharacterized protein